MLVFPALLLGSVACGPPPDGGKIGTSQQALVNGFVTSARPEVGDLGGCTATLLRPRWLLTAAHCWTNLDALPTWRFGVFSTTTDGRTWTARSGSSNSFAFNDLGPDQVVGNEDVMLLRLATPVASTVATPALIADAPPAPGSNITLFGNGHPRPGLKQAFVGSAGWDGVLPLPGDSGGPTMIGIPIWAEPTVPQSITHVTSGFGAAGIYADVTRKKAELTAVMDAWDASADRDIATSGWCTHDGARLHYADADGDHRPDAICHDRNSGWRWLARGRSRLIQNDPAAVSRTPFCNGLADLLFVGQVNVDGREDSICQNLSSGLISVDYAESPAGSYFGAADFTSPAPWCWGIALRLFVGDFDGDGQTDLLCHDREAGRTFVDLADDAGHYGGTDWDSGIGLRHCRRELGRLLVGDTDNDGRSDLLCHNGSTGALSVSKSNGAAPFFDAVDWKTVPEVTTVASRRRAPFCFGPTQVMSLGDYNGDGRGDLLCTDTATGNTYPSLWGLNPATQVPAGANNVYNTDTKDYSGYQFGGGPVRIRRVSAALPWAPR